MEYVRDINGTAWRTDELYSLGDLFDLACDGLEWAKPVFDTALFNARAAAEGREYESIEQLSDIISYQGEAFTDEGGVLQLSDEPPFEVEELKEINRAARIFKSGKYVIEIYFCDYDRCYQIWISKNGYGLKEFVIGLQKMEAAVEYVERALPEMIADFEQNIAERYER